MATWKKVIVSGSNAHLTGITSSVLTVNNILQAGTGGAIQNSGITLSSNTLALGANSITSTGTNSVLTGSFAGTFSGSLSVNLQDLTNGTGISAFTYDGNSAATVAVSGASSLSSNTLSKWTGAAFVNSTIIDNGTNITTNIPISSSSTISASGFFSPGYNYFNTILPVGSNPIIGDNTSTTPTGRFGLEGKSIRLVSNAEDWPLIIYTGSIASGNEIFKVRRDTRRVAINLSNANALSYGLQVEDTFFARASTISQSLTVIGPISASGNISGSTLHIAGTGTITGNTTVGGTLGVTGTTTLTGDLLANGNTTLGNATDDAVTVNAQTVTLQNPLTVSALSSTMLVLTSSNRVATQTLGTGIATFLNSPSSANLAAAVTDETGTGTLVFSASPTFTGTVTTTNISAGGTLGVTGATTLTGALTVNSTISASGNISGSTLRIVGNESIGGNSAIGGTLDVTGTTTLAGNLLANGNTTLGNATGDTLIISGSSISVPSIAAGTTDTVIIRTATNELATRTIDTRVWGSTLVDASGTPVANQVPYWTDANTLAGEAGFTYNPSTDVFTAPNVVVTSNLTVQGTASFQQTTNLEVADRFILLASGSNTAGEGGIVVQQATQNVGEIFGWDNDALRWAVTSSFTANQSTFTPDAFMAAVTTAAGTTPSVAARYSAVGNIYVSSGDESIWIYS